MESIVNPKPKANQKKKSNKGKKEIVEISPFTIKIEYGTFIIFGD